MLQEGAAESRGAVGLSAEGGHASESADTLGGERWDHLLPRDLDFLDECGGGCGGVAGEQRRKPLVAADDGQRERFAEHFRVVRRALEQLAGGLVLASAIAM